MRQLVMMAVLALGAVGLAGCVGPGYEEAVEERYAQKEAEWKASNPDGVVTKEVMESLMAQAVAEIKKEFMEKYGESGAGIVSSVASGNIVGAVWGALGLLGVFLGIKKPKGVSA